MYHNTSTSVPYWSVSGFIELSATINTGTLTSGIVEYTNDGINYSVSIGTDLYRSNLAVTDRSKATTFTYKPTGTGLNPASSIQLTLTDTISAASKYYPLFWKRTTNSTVPTLTTSDSTASSSTFSVGQGATTTATTTNYLWIATPQSVTWNKYFKFTVGGVTATAIPAVTTTQTISGIAYDVFGFTNYSAATFIFTSNLP